MPDRNPYLDLLNASPAATGAAPHDNPYLATLDALDAGRQAQLRANLATAVDTKPDEYAQQKRVAGYLGYPPAAVEALPEQASREAKVKQVAEHTADSTTLQRRYGDADFAKLAHDDSGVLSSLAAVARYMFSFQDEANTLAGTAGSAMLKGSAGWAGVFRAGAEAAADAAEFAYPGLRYNEQHFVAGGNPLRRVAEGFAMIARGNVAKAAEINPPVQGVLAGGAISGVESLLQNALMLPAAMLPGGQAALLSGASGIPAGPAFASAR